MTAANKLFHPDEISIALVEDDILREVARCLYYHIAQRDGSKLDWKVFEPFPSGSVSYYVNLFLRKTGNL